MKPKYIDIHAHVNFKDFSEDREQVVERALKNGVWVINSGTNHNTSTEVVRLAHKYDDGVYATVGVHPIDRIKEDFNEQHYKNLLEDRKVVAIGECGLDFFRLDGSFVEEKNKQENIFRKQIEVAVKFDKPIVIHCRDAYADVLRILKEYKEKSGDRLRGDIHFFSGSKSEAKQFLDLGLDLSFAGVITFSSQYEDLVKFIPLERMHAETDCPYVAPIPHRGKRNEPMYVVEVVKKIAEIKNLSLENVSEQLVENTRRLFGI